MRSTAFADITFLLKTFQYVPFPLAIGVPDPYQSLGRCCHLAIAQLSSLICHYSVLPSRLRPFVLPVGSQM